MEAKKVPANIIESFARFIMEVIICVKTRHARQSSSASIIIGNKRLIPKHFEQPEPHVEIKIKCELSKECYWITQSPTFYAANCMNGVNLSSSRADFELTEKHFRGYIQGNRKGTSLLMELMTPHFMANSEMVKYCYFTEYEASEGKLWLGMDCVSYAEGYGAATLGQMQNDFFSPVMPRLDCCGTCWKGDCITDQSGARENVCFQCLEKHNKQCKATFEETTMTFYYASKDTGLIGYCQECLGSVKDKFLDQPWLFHPVFAPNHLACYSILERTDYGRQFFYHLSMINPQTPEGITFFHCIPETACRK
jgi:hypothetical protein